MVRFGRQGGQPMTTERIPEAATEACYNRGRNITRRGRIRRSAAVAWPVPLSDRDGRDCLEGESGVEVVGHGPP